MTPISASKGKTIRDAVHGDIYIPEKFVRIIDTPEFQRLHRIRQLSTAYLLFPTAEHTRFSHSIGAFYTMTLLINHFELVLKNINVEIPERDRNLALCVALLHDIGHGPFSHAFENALPSSLKQKKHEAWTIDIITSKESQINKVIIENFGPHFPTVIAALIKKDYRIRGFGSDKPRRKLDLLFIVQSLISSQLDADRMDYLLRDAFFTGVSYGKFDLSRLVRALTLTIHGNNFFVCVHEKYLPAIEEYLLARYHMHDSVYLHKFKNEMELLLKKIFYRAYELYRAGNLKADLPIALEIIFNGETVTVADYISLDDAVIVAMLLKWEKNEDQILAALCSSILNRRKYKQVAILMVS